MRLYGKCGKRSNAGALPPSRPPPSEGEGKTAKRANDAKGKEAGGRGLGVSWRLGGFALEMVTFVLGRGRQKVGGG